MVRSQFNHYIGLLTQYRRHLTLVCLHLRQRGLRYDPKALLMFVVRRSSWQTVYYKVVALLRHLQCMIQPHTNVPRSPSYNSGPEWKPPSKYWHHRWQWAVCTMDGENMVEIRTEATADIRIFSSSGNVIYVPHSWDARRSFIVTRLDVDWTSIFVADLAANVINLLIQWI